MSGGRSSKRNMFRNLESAVRRGRGGKGKEWGDCVQSDSRELGVAGSLGGWAEVYDRVEERRRRRG